MIELSIDDYFGEEIELEIDGEYVPYEQRTWEYEGQDEDFIINSVFVSETGAEVCLLGDVEKSILERISSWRYVMLVEKKQHI